MGILYNAQEITWTTYNLIKKVWDELVQTGNF